VRLAILTQYYPPETGAPQNRLSDLARRLTARGHEVQVLTALPNYPGDAVLREYRGRENTVEILDGVRVARVGLLVSRRKTFARRMACYLSFALNARRHGPRLLGPADVLLMESPPLFLALAGVGLARTLGAPLVTNVSDLWPESAVALGVIGPGALLRMAERLEAWMYRRSALITAQTEGIADDIRRRFPDARVVLFPNGVDLDAYDRPLDRAAIRREFGWDDDVFVLGYTGVFGHAQALDQILDAARLLEGVEGVHFALIGDGPCREALERRIAGERLRSVRVYPRQPAWRMPSVQAALDAGLVPLRRGRLFEGTRPSKMFEVMAAARPVVLCARGEAEAIVTGAAGGPAGIVVPPEEPAELAAAIRSLLLKRDEAAEMGRQGQQLVRQRFDRAITAVQIERVLLDVVAQRRGSDVLRATAPPPDPRLATASEAPWGTRQWFGWKAATERYDDPASYFGHGVSGYHRHRHGRLVETLRTGLSQRRPTSFLDIGSGLGDLTAMIHREHPVGLAVGIDFAEAAVALAQRRFPEIRFMVAELPVLPFTDGAFDVVSACEVLYHVVPEARPRAVDEIHRVLAVDGVVLLSSVLDPAAGIQIEEARRLLSARFSVERVTVDANALYHRLMRPIVLLHALARLLEIPRARRRRRRPLVEHVLAVMANRPLRAILKGACAVSRPLLGSRVLARGCGRLGTLLAMPGLRTNVTIVARKVR
jgi:glycosyltransferase involved in cell wall biosynthesis/ubiquinone/menaquinone biosynthesis C-methylase UbiE